MGIAATSRWRSLVLHIVAIAAFIFFELSYVLFVGTGAKAYVFIIFYTLDILFFLFLGLFYLPYISQSFESRLIQLLLFIVPVVIYSIVIAGIGDVLEGLGNHSFSIKITRIDFFRSYNRSFYLLVLAAFYWYSKFSILKERKAKQLAVAQLQLEKRNVQLENAYLRAQVNPHLMYNFLSSVYLRLFEKAPAESEMILGAAELMRYAASEPSEDGKVALEDDLANLRHLIELNQAQYGQPLALDLGIRLMPEAAGVKVPPLLFADLVQNIFKYGDLRQPGRPATVSVFCDGKTLHFLARNAVASRRMAGAGTGLGTARRRLEKHFPGRHYFKEIVEEDEFVVDIKIEL